MLQSIQPNITNTKFIPRRKSKFQPTFGNEVFKPHETKNSNYRYLDIFTPVKEPNKMALTDSYPISCFDINTSSHSDIREGEKLFRIKNLNSFFLYLLKSDAQGISDEFTDAFIDYTTRLTEERLEIQSQRFTLEKLKSTIFNRQLTDEKKGVIFIAKDLPNVTALKHATDYEVYDLRTTTIENSSLINSKDKNKIVILDYETIINHWCDIYESKQNQLDNVLKESILIIDFRTLYNKTNYQTFKDITAYSAERIELQKSLNNSTLPILLTGNIDDIENLLDIYSKQLRFQLIKISPEAKIDDVSNIITKMKHECNKKCIIYVPNIAKYFALGNSKSNALLELINSKSKHVVVTSTTKPNLLPLNLKQIQKQIDFSQLNVQDREQALRLFLNDVWNKIDLLETKGEDITPLDISPNQISYLTRMIDINNLTITEIRNIVYDAYEEYIKSSKGNYLEYLEKSINLNRKD